MQDVIFCFVLFFLVIYVSNLMKKYVVFKIEFSTVLFKKLFFWLLIELRKKKGLVNLKFYLIFFVYYSFVILILLIKKKTLKIKKCCVYFFSASVASFGFRTRLPLPLSFFKRSISSRKSRCSSL